MIHHFRCAYIGPESDFRKNDFLQCPKCNHKLKHIGIDYDKPSEIHTCKNCNHKSQETKMKAKCIDCRKENELDQLSTYSIFNYTPTEKGRQLAKQEFTSKNLIVKSHSTSSNFIIPFSAYNLLRKHEIKKR